MQRTMLKSKIQRAKVMSVDLHLDDCLILDRDLMRRADIWPFERVEIYSYENGARFTTSVIEGESGSGMVRLCGPAAHLVKHDHRIAISTFVTLTETDLVTYRPKLISLDERNHAV